MLLKETRFKYNVVGRKKSKRIKSAIACKHKSKMKSCGGYTNARQRRHESKVDHKEKGGY